jgi:hypothetical protein
MPKRKKTRRRRGYHRGLHVSPFAGECKFRSSWEEKYMQLLDTDPNVSTWSYEKLIIEYVSNQRTGKVRKYYPDFLIEMKDGTKLVVEIKQRRKLDNLIVKKKIIAATEWCLVHGATYKVLTEIELRQLGVI